MSILYKVLAVFLFIYSLNSYSEDAALEMYLDYDVSMANGSKYHFSRAECRFPTEIHLPRHIHRNESITWDVEEFHRRLENLEIHYTESSILYAIRTISGHYRVIPKSVGGSIERLWVLDHADKDERDWGIWSYVTHLDDTRPFWLVVGLHEYKGPVMYKDYDFSVDKVAAHLKTKPWIRVSDTVARDCNLYSAQFFGDAGDWKKITWWDKFINN